jgi:RNA polymerase sigma-54 factor
MLLQSQKTTIRPVTTAHLAQTMTLLELTSDELRQKLDSALASNPALELADNLRCPSCQRLLIGSRACPVCSSPSNFNGNEPIIFVSPSSDFRTGLRLPAENDSPLDDWTAAEEDLPTYVLRQIAPDLEINERKIAAHILTSLDKDGLLRIPIIEIARFHHVAPSKVERVIQIIQRAEPIGVGSQSPEDALLAQLDVLSEARSVPPLTERAIREGMHLLSRRSLNELGRLLGVTQEVARNIATFISDNLNPYPARAHWGGHRTSTVQPRTYQRPDMIIRLIDDDKNGPLIVEIISPYAGSLRINSSFRKALSQAPSDKQEQWQSDLDTASLLIKCIQQRNNTLVRLMQRLVVLQRRFILSGEINLVPLTRAQLALELDVHESTVSRAVSGKSVQLPNKRIVPLAIMFDRSLPIRTILKQIIAREIKPLSDQQLTEKLEEEGYTVARRTVAKYRAMEGILPARLRKGETASIRI